MDNDVLFTEEMIIMDIVSAWRAMSEGDVILTLSSVSNKKLNNQKIHHQLNNPLDDLILTYEKHGIKIEDYHLQKALKVWSKRKDLPEPLKHGLKRYLAEIYINREYWKDYLKQVIAPVFILVSIVLIMLLFVFNVKESSNPNEQLFSTLNTSYLTEKAVWQEALLWNLDRGTPTEKTAWDDWTNTLTKAGQALDDLQEITNDDDINNQVNVFNNWLSETQTNKNIATQIHKEAMLLDELSIKTSLLKQKIQTLNNKNDYLKNISDIEDLINIGNAFMAQSLLNELQAKITDEEVEL